MNLRKKMLLVLKKDIISNVSNEWYLAGGASAPVAAYKPRGKATQADSYINLVNPGTYDAFIGIAPTMMEAGWHTDGTARLGTGILPNANSSFIVKISAWNGDNPNVSGNIIIGQNSSGAQQLPIVARYLAQNSYVYGTGTTKPARFTEGVIAMCANKVYHDGVLVGTVDSEMGTITKNVGLLGYGDGDVACVADHIQEYIAIYDYDISDSVAAITAAIYADAEATTPSLSITTPVDYQVIQRDGNDEADIVNTGVYVRDTTVTVEGAWGGDYVNIDESPAAGAYSGTMAGQSIGQNTLHNRYADNPTVIFDKEYVGIGDVFICSGQSNMGANANNAQSSTHATLKASQFPRASSTWSELTDQTDAESYAKSCWPLVATSYMANENAPVAFCRCQFGSSSISEWQSGGTNFNYIVAQYNKVGSAKCILWHQGETDAGEDMSQGDYQTYLDAFVTAISAACGGIPVMIAKLQICNAHTTVQRNTINAGIDYVVTNNVHAIAGPDFSDYEISSVVHFETDEDVAVQGARWWAAIKAAFSW